MSAPLTGVAVASEPTLPRHTQIGPYEVLDRLAVGGMAEIYLARRIGIEGFEKRVVLKRVLPSYVNDAEFTTMFLNEARLAARLDHPNVVQVIDIGVVDDEYFFVMEYLHGRNLREVIREAGHRRVLPLEVALNVAVGVAAGLHHAHECRDENGDPLEIVHRDVSPSNVLVTYDGHVKLVDFGIAKAASARSQTVTGTLKGKVGYMAPEQFRGRPVDRRTDVFALGITLYEMTVGHRPFRGENEFAILTAALEGAYERPSARIPKFPPQLEAILARALAADPNDRFETAEAFQAAIEDLAGELGIAVGPSTVRKFMRESFEIPSLVVVDRRPDADAAARSMSSFRSNTSVDPTRVTSGLMGRFTPVPVTQRWAGAAIFGGVMSVPLVGGIILGVWLTRSDPPSTTLEPAMTVQHDEPASPGVEPGPTTTADRLAGRPSVTEFESDDDRAELSHPASDVDPTSDAPDESSTAPSDTNPSAKDTAAGMNGAKKRAKPSSSSKRPKSRPRPSSDASASTKSSLFPPSHYD